MRNRNKTEINKYFKEYLIAFADPNINIPTENNDPTKISNFITLFNNAYYNFLEGNMEPAIAIFSKKLDSATDGKEKERFSSWIKYLTRQLKPAKRGE